MRVSPWLSAWPTVLGCFALAFASSCSSENSSPPTNPASISNKTSPATANAAQSAADSTVSTSSPPGAARPAPNRFRWRELADAAGLAWTYRNGSEQGHSTILESLGVGVGLCDYDGDQRLDVFLPGGGRFGDSLNPEGLPSALFRNLGSGVFSAVTSQAGVTDARRFTHGVAAADYDNDGCCDILVTGYGGLQLWRNQGDGAFQDVTEESGLSADRLWSSSAAWGDFNGDGQLDLYVAHYVNWSPANHPVCPAPIKGEREICSPRDFLPLPDSLFLSDGQGGFRDLGSTAGVSSEGKGLGVVLGDIDLDGDLDAYVANDTTENHLYINDGRGQLTETGLAAGVATDDRGIPDGSMGVDIADFNRDGRPDLWVANYEREAFALYRNEGQGQFLHVSQLTGITALGGLFVGFGTSFFDVDLDGDEDVFVANGHVIKYPRTAPRRQLPLLLENQAGHFVRVEFPRGEYFGEPWEARGLAAGDLDDDGDVDLAIAHVNEPTRLLLNETVSAQASLSVRLVGTQSNRNAIGAHLLLVTPEGAQLRLVKGGGSYLSQSDYRVVWAVPPHATSQRLVIHWPSGVQQQLTLDAPGSHIVVEPLAHEGSR